MGVLRKTGRCPTHRVFSFISSDLATLSFNRLSLFLDPKFNFSPAEMLCLITSPSSFFLSCLLKWPILTLKWGF
jgi:hypothetical protein